MSRKGEREDILGSQFMEAASVKHICPISPFFAYKGSALSDYHSVLSKKFSNCPKNDVTSQHLGQTVRLKKTQLSTTIIHVQK